MARLGHKAAAMAAVMAIGCMSTTAQAGWHGWWGGSSGGSSGSWGSSGGSSGSWGSSGGYYSSGGSSGSSGGSSGYYSSGGSSGSSGGLISRLIQHHRAHKYYRSYYSSGGSSGGSSGYYSSGGSSGGSSGYYSSGGSSGGSSGAYGGSYYYEAPSSGAPATPAPAESTMPTPMTSAQSDAVINVNVPVETKIFVNGKATTSEGLSRRFVSRNLMPGFKYVYQLRAESVVNGKKVVETKEVQLGGGDSANVSFEFNGSGEEQVASDPVDTKLTLHVPANAKVTLAGNDTASTGELRTYNTGALKKGDVWNNYTILVTVNKDGREITKEKVINLAAGEDRNISFDFNSTELASAK